MSANNIPKWVKEKKKYNDENPSSEYVNFPENKITKVEINITIQPEIIEGKFNKRVLYTLIDGKKMTVPQGFDRLIVEKLMLGQTILQILRTGLDKQTRYSIVE